MNNKIAELVAAEMDEYYKGAYHDSACARDQLARFAERIVRDIVRECADIVANSSLPDAYSEPALAIIAEEIKEHFGVSHD